MLNQPMSSPMMNTMFGFFAACCAWAARGGRLEQPWQRSLRRIRVWRCSSICLRAADWNSRTLQAVQAVTIESSTGRSSCILSGEFWIRRIRLLQPHEQPLLGAVLAEVDQRGGFVLGQVVESGLDDVGRVVADGEGDALRALIDRAVDELRLVGAVSV